MAPLAPPRRRLGTLNKPAPGRPKPKAAPVKTCCDEPDIQDEDGSKVCINCGTQISEANIVADVTFEEDARGAATVQGGFIGENARHARTLGTGAYRKIGGGERNSAQEVEKTARAAIQPICHRLGIPKSVEDQAVLIFTISAQVGFTAGRRTNEVAAACVFAACRKAPGNTTMLMDIAEIQKINVFRLGEVYKALCEKLEYHQQRVGIQHTVDVEPLVQKYCRKLEFGAKTRDVATDAVRIMKRMKRDWIVTGRHPAGLCGACIILAARMNNFRRSVREVVYVAKVADMTIAKRVEEFRRTKASGLTVEQFREFGTRMVTEADPPILQYTKERQEKFKEKQQARRWAALAREAEEEGREVEPIVIEDDGDANSSRGSTATPEVNDGEENGHRRKRRRTSGPATQQERRVDGDGFAVPGLPASQLDPALGGQADGASENGTPASTSISPPKRKRGRPRKNQPAPEPIQITPEELGIEEQLTEEINEVLYDEDIQQLQNQAAQEAADERARQALEAIQPLADAEREAHAAREAERREAEGVDWAAPRAPVIPTANMSGEPEVEVPPTEKELEIEFADDPEVLNCLLSTEESRLKEQIWVAHNEDWLRAQHEKELIKRIAEAAAAEKGTKGPSKRGGRGSRGGGRGGRGRKGDRSVLETAETPIETPADAASAMLRKRAPAAFSKYIDYESLARVYNQGGTSSIETSRSRAGSEAASRAGSVAASSAAGTPAGVRTRDFGLASPRATQVATQARAGTQTPAPAPRSPSRPLTPPETQLQQGQATAGAEREQPAEEEQPAEDPEAEAEGEGEEEYQSEAGSDEGGGWGDGGYDDREDIGEDEDMDYNRAIDPYSGVDMEMGGEEEW